MQVNSHATFSNLVQVVEYWTQQHPDHAALLAPSRPTLTYSAFFTQLTTLGQSFQRLGLGQLARVAILAPNSPELALAFLGSASYATSAPLNPAYQKDELAFYLDDLEASALLVASTLKTPARDVAHARGIPILELCSEAEQAAGCFSIEGKTGRSPVSTPSRQSDDIALILHTSGTTARPKQVPLTHGNLCASITHLHRSLALTPQDCCLNLMPLFHIHGLVGALLASLGSGGSVVCPPGFSPTEVFGWLQAFRPTWFTAVPTIHQAILAQVQTASQPIPANTLRFIRSSSASLAPTIMADLEKRFGVPVIEAYGMTEAAHQMASNPLPPNIRKPGSVGLPAGPEIQIVSEAEDPLSIGQIGEVVIRGPNVMTGYSHNPMANEQAFTQGWFRTGDQGYVDADGYLFLTGRIKEQINRGGEKIAPLEIDQVLLQHSSIQQAVTFAMPHSTLGEEVAAAVVLRKDARLTEQGLRHWLQDRLAHFKTPKKLFFLPDIPKGPTGKIQRRVLAEQLLGSLAPSAKGHSEKLENLLVSLFQRHLEIEQIGKDDNFFMLGGDSIRATQIANRIQNLTPSLTIDAVTIFEHPTVAELHAYILANVGPKTLIDFFTSLEEQKNPVP
jgi:acyl-CoA synthetase (AMP-forming)/AMP-acid ligase II/aryl carrier-like protein